MQTLLRDPAAGIMHSLIYFSFLILLAVTTILEINHQVPESLKFLHGRIYQGYSLVGDAAGLGLFVGVAWAIVRRYVVRPYRIRIKSKPEHALGLGTLLALAVTGFGAEAWRIAAEGTPDVREVVVHRLPDRHADRRHRAASTAATRSGGCRTCCSFIAFLVILPVTMLRHMFTSPLNMYLRDRSAPRAP